jgi:signal peptidase I
VGETTKLLLNALAAIVIALVVVRILFVEAVAVQDNGMAPTLVYGDEVWMWKGAGVDMADVVVCPHPAQPDELVIGRAIAFAGHSVHTDMNGQLYVDDDRTATEYEGTRRFYDDTRDKEFEMMNGMISYGGQHDHAFFLERGDSFRVPRNSVERGVYLLGDNRSERSFDSREFGEVDPDTCLGQVFMIWKPAPDRDDEVSHHMLEWVQ